MIFVTPVGRNALPERPGNVPEHPKTAPRRPKTAPRRPKRRPRRPKRPTRRPKRRPRRPTRRPRRPQDAPRSAQDAPKTAQEAPKAGSRHRPWLRGGSRIDIFSQGSPAEDKRRYNYLLGVVKKQSKEANIDLTRRWATGPAIFFCRVSGSNSFKKH